MSGRNGGTAAFMGSAFSYDAERDILLCPAGQKLTQALDSRNKDKNPVTCHPVPLKPQYRDPWSTH